MASDDSLHPTQFFFHGTSAKLARGAVIRPSSQSNFGAGVSDQNYAYATPDQSNAWHYAETAWNNTGGRPRVYRVEPIGEHEADPELDEHGSRRGNFDGDRRSQQGWRVLNERSMPGHMGPPEDWDE